LHLRKQEQELDVEQELKTDHGDLQASMVEEQHIVVGDYLEDVDIVVPEYFHN
jgi:hypothetical protein